MIQRPGTKERWSKGKARIGHVVMFVGCSRAMAGRAIPRSRRSRIAWTRVVLRLPNRSGSAVPLLSRSLDARASVVDSEATTARAAFLSVSLQLSMGRGAGFAGSQTGRARDGVHASEVITALGHRPNPSTLRT
jgi:hypothetical protein